MTLVLGVAASVVANILHALDNPISQAIAAWPPLALLLTVELISRVPVHRRSLAVARLLATATFAGNQPPGSPTGTWRRGRALTARPVLRLICCRSSVDGLFIRPPPPSICLVRTRPRVMIFHPGNRSPLRHGSGQSGSAAQVLGHGSCSGLGQ
jgi:hypothetical protein